MLAFESRELEAKLHSLRQRSLRVGWFEYVQVAQRVWLLLLLLLL